jgi:hypothetical protein
MNLFITLLENVNKSRTSANDVSLIVSFCVYILPRLDKQQQRNKEISRQHLLFDLPVRVGVAVGM